MAGIRSFFRTLFGLETKPSDVICRKIGNSYFAYRKVQGNYQQFDGPFTTCEQCKASCGATECREE